jgi:hypothetical protein
MKKLLALVLCVVMVLSLAPAAFAAWPTTAASNKAISNAKANIEYAYSALAADTAVFGTIKTVDSIVTDMAKGLFNGVDKYDIKWGNGYMRLYNSDLVDNAKELLRAEIGASISTYMSKHAGDWYKVTVTLIDPYWSEQINPTTGKKYTASLSYTGIDDGVGSHIYVSKDVPNLYYGVTDGGTWYYISAESAEKAAAGIGIGGTTWNQVQAVNKPYQKSETQADPVKYMNTFAAAVSDAFASEKGAAAIERLYYDLYLAKLQIDVADKLDDLADEIKAWQGDDDLLAAYGWHSVGNWNPYAFIDTTDLPKALDSYVGAVTAFDPLNTPWYPND